MLLLLTLSPRVSSGRSRSDSSRRLRAGLKRERSVEHALQAEAERLQSIKRRQLEHKQHASATASQPLPVRLLVELLFMRCDSADHADVESAQNAAAVGQLVGDAAW